MLLKPWRMSCNLRIHTNLTNLIIRLVAETGASKSSADIAKVGAYLGCGPNAPACRDRPQAIGDDKARTELTYIC